MSIYGTDLRRCCGKWISEDDDNASHFAYEAWLFGYLSGVAYAVNKDILKDTDRPSIELWMDNYCKANPLNKVYQGANDLYFELVKQKGL